MPLATTHLPTAASLFPDWLQVEDDDSIPLANVTSVSTGADFIQANGFIGDGPYGSTTGDFDAFRVNVTSDLFVDIDAQILDSGLNAFIEIRNNAGVVVASNDDEAGVGLDPFLRVFSLDPGIYTIVIRATGSFLTNPNNSASGTGVASTGAYRVFINNFGDSSGAPHLFHGDNNGTNLNGADDEDILVGNRGNDTLQGRGADDLFVWSNGDGDDTVIGGDGLDVQEVNAGSLGETFTLIPFFAPGALLGITVGGVQQAVLILDVEGLDLRALGGNDTFIVDDMAGRTLTAPINFWAGEGNDVLDATSSINKLVTRGEAGADRLTGSKIADTLFGGAGNDTLDGGLGGDAMAGGAGNDTFVVDNILDSVAEQAGEGTDLVRAAFSYVLGKEIENLQLLGTVGLSGTGNTLANAIAGNNGNNLLRGLEGADSLSGGAGDDTLSGGLGLDILTGGEGNDSFLFDTKPTKKKTNFDHVTEFAAGFDLILLEADIFKKVNDSGALKKKFFASGKADDHNDFIIYKNKNDKLLYDKDGDGKAKAKLVAILDNALDDIGAGDLLVV